MPDSSKERYRRASVRRAERGSGQATVRDRVQDRPEGFAPRLTGHPGLFSVSSAYELSPWDDGGGFPQGFLPWAIRTMGVRDPENLLHLCSGSVHARWTVDIRPETPANFHCDVRKLPFEAESFDAAIADPPYDRTWAKVLYGISARKYPAPGAIVREAMRVLRPGGRLGLLHYLVPPYPVDAARLVGVWGVWTGPGSQIRAWTVLEKRERTPVLRTDVGELELAVG